MNPVLHLCIRTSLLLGVTTLCLGQTPAKIPYKCNFDPTDPMTLKVKLKIGDQMSQPAWFTMDTGSVGIVMPAGDLPSQPPDAQPGEIKYTSSGVVWKGFWTKQPISFTDAAGKTLATANAQVFGAQTPSCTGNGPNAKNCDLEKLENNPPHMMGIGFGRPDRYAFPTRNPAIHVEGVSEQSYLIDQTGLTLGLPLQALKPNCVRQSLEPNQKQGFAGDWMTPTGTLAIDGAKAPANILLDTGVNDMLIGAASKPTSGLLSNGTKIQIGFLGGQTSMDYTVVTPPPAVIVQQGTSQYTPGTPTSFHWIDYYGKDFVNTGITPLMKYSYYFNSTRGVAALCPLQ